MLATTTQKITNRVLFFDNLRYLMVLLVVILHATISYSSIVPWWCVRDTAWAVLDVVMLLLDVFLMPILYFIAGYFAIPSIQNRDPWLFLRRKFKRLGLPLLLGIPLISPAFAYIYHYSRNDFSWHLAYWEYWVLYIKSAGQLNIGTISSIDQFSHAHLWFISLLLFFFVIFALCTKMNKRYGISFLSDFSKSTSAKTVLVAFCIVGVLSTASSFGACKLFSSVADPEPWVTIGNLLQFQSTRLVLYILYFVMGIYAFSRQWFTTTGIPGHPVAWMVSSILLSLSFLIILKQMMMNFSVGALFLYLCLRSFLCLSFLAVFLSAGFRYWNRPSRFNALLASNSYHIYIVHMFIVVMLQLILAAWPGGPVFIKFAIVSLASIIISYAVSQYALKPYPRLSVMGIYALFLIIAFGIN